MIQPDIAIKPLYVLGLVSIHQRVQGLQRPYSGDNAMASARAPKRTASRYPTYSSLVRRAGEAYKQHDAANERRRRSVGRGIPGEHICLQVSGGGKSGVQVTLELSSSIARQHQILPELFTEVVDVHCAHFMTQWVWPVAVFRSAIGAYAGRAVCTRAFNCFGSFGRIVYRGLKA